MIKSIFITHLMIITLSLPCSANILQSVPNYEKIDAINKMVNASIAYQRDIDHFNKSDLWLIPKDGKGDCEDYVLAKHKKLKDIGIDSFIALCRTKKGTIHAVLFVHSRLGALVLNNSTDKIRVAADYKRLGYEWIEIQVGDKWFDYKTKKETSAPYGYRVWIKSKRRSKNEQRKNKRRKVRH